jgi:hypothetical protein
MALGFAAAGAAAAGALVVGLKKSVDAAIDAEKSQARLEAQLKASGISYRAHAKEIDAVIQKHSQLAGLDDEDCRTRSRTSSASTGSVNKSDEARGPRQRHRPGEAHGRREGRAARRQGRGREHGA